MTPNEKLEVLKGMVGVVGNGEDKLLQIYLDTAAQKIIERVYPFDSTKEDVPKKYSYRQCEIAAYLWNKRGAEGEISHDENGIRRTYENADVPESMLKGVIPFVGVL